MTTRTKAIPTANSDKPTNPTKHLSIREAQKMMTRDRLLDAAADLFKEVGFREVTIFQIMERAQANRATFYLHFKDKLDLAVAVARRIGASQNTKLFKEFAEFKNPTVDEVRAWIEKRIVLLVDPLLVAVMHEATLDRNFAKDYGAYQEYLADIVMKKMYAHLDARQQKIVRSKIILLTMMTDRFAQQTQHDRPEFADKSFVKAMSEMLWQAVFADQGKTASRSPKSRSPRRRDKRAG